MTSLLGRKTEDACLPVGREDSPRRDRPELQVIRIAKKYFNKSELKLEIR